MKFYQNPYFIIISILLVCLAIFFIISGTINPIKTENNYQNSPYQSGQDMIITQPPIDQSDSSVSSPGLSGQGIMPTPDIGIIEPAVPPVMPPEGEAVFCTMDAKMCPDGSYVGRVGPSCEFAPCP